MTTRTAVTDAIAARKILQRDVPGPWSYWYGMRVSSLHRILDVNMSFHEAIGSPEHLTDKVIDRMNAAMTAYDERYAR